VGEKWSIEGGAQAWWQRGGACKQKGAQKGMRHERKRAAGRDTAEGKCGRYRLRHEDITKKNTHPIAEECLVGKQAAADRRIQQLKKTYKKNRLIGLKR